MRIYIYIAEHVVSRWLRRAVRSRKPCTRASSSAVLACTWSERARFMVIISIILILGLVIIIIAAAAAAAVVVVIGVVVVKIVIEIVIVIVIN